MSSWLQEAPGVNGNLCRALLRAGLTEEDVATRLQVDPKTVRRWLEGRLPYLRHRWALAAMLGADETDPWPQLRAAGARPAEVRAIYPHLDAVPREVWLDLFGSARQAIDIPAVSEPPFAGDPAIVAALAERARARVKVRICLAAAHGPPEQQAAVSQHTYGISPERAPALRLQRAGDASMASMYIAEFERLWAESSAPL